MKNCPTRVGIICENSPKSKLSEIYKTKYFCELNMNVLGIKNAINNKIGGQANKGLFILVNDKIPLLDDKETVKSIYEKYKDEDGFLYITYTDKIPVGCNPLIFVFTGVLVLLLSVGIGSIFFIKKFV